MNTRQSGRLSDLFNPSKFLHGHDAEGCGTIWPVLCHSHTLPEYVFVIGTALLSFTSLGAGFVRSEIPLIVLRALMGVGKL